VKCLCSDATGQGWRKFLRALRKFSINFEKILWLAYGNFEEQNMVLAPSIIIIIDKHYN
jgi:hypothetical protein